MKNLTIKLLFLLITGSSAFAQNNKADTTRKFTLPKTISYLDSNKDETISSDEAISLFDKYLMAENKGSQNDSIQCIESNVIDLISYLEAVDCSRVKKTVAANRFIEVYYITKFNSSKETSFGLNLGFTEDEKDSSYVSEPLIPIKKK